MPKNKYSRRPYKKVGTASNPAFDSPITIAAIDSGAKGAIAILKFNSRTDIDLISVYDMPYNDESILPHIETLKVAKWICDADYVVLESVNPVKGKGTAHTMFRQGGSYFPLGEAVSLAGKSDHFDTYSAQLWKATLGVQGEVNGNKKTKTFDLVCTLFPDQLDLFCGPRGGMLDGRTDAIAIGLAWGKRNVK